jgi:hypothetical protein
MRSLVSLSSSANTRSGMTESSFTSVASEGCEDVSEDYVDLYFVFLKNTPLFPNFLRWENGSMVRNSTADPYTRNGTYD